MDEIIFELREHSSGLNCGRWDYIFSMIKKFRNDPKYILPDRSDVTMTTPFMDTYVRLLIKTCHKRGVHAMGGMAAQIPIKNDPRANEEALAKVTADKEREVTLGHDGTWVAHPALVPVARSVFDAHMKSPNQIEKKPATSLVTAKDLLTVPQGEITEAGLRNNVSVGLQYLEAWLGGNGCVPLYNLMEDAATAEISRAQIWQWIRYGAKLADGRQVTPQLYNVLLPQELARIEKEIGTARYQGGHFEKAIKLFTEMSKSPVFVEFLTLPAYEAID